MKETRVFALTLCKQRNASRRPSGIKGWATYRRNVGSTARTLVSGRLDLVK